MMTRTEKALNKAMKAKVAAYKATKRAVEVFYEDVALELTPEQALEKALRERYTFLDTREAEETGLLKAIIQDTLENDKSIDDLSLESVQHHITPFCSFFNYRPKTWGQVMDAVNGIAYSGMNEYDYRDLHFTLGRAPTESELDFYAPFFKWLSANGISKVNAVEDWAKAGYPVDESELLKSVAPMKFYGVTNVRERSFLEVLRTEMPFTDGNSIMNLFKAVSSKELKHYTKRTDVTVQELAELYVQGKYRKIKEYSMFLTDRLEAKGLPVPVTQHSADAAWKVLAALDNGVKFNNKAFAKHAKLDVFVNYADVYAFMLLGDEGLNLNASHHLLDAKPVAIPEGAKKVVALNDHLITWVFFKDLSIDWSVSKSPKTCVLEALKTAYSLTEQQANVLFENPSMDEAVEFQSQYPQTVKDVLPEANFEYEGYTLTKLAKDSLDNLVMGDLTACCQKMGGAGEDVCIEGWNDAHSVNYVFKNAKGVTLAHFWAWEATDGMLVIDSIEGRSHMPVDVVYELIHQFLDSIPDTPVAIGHCDYGFTENIIKMFTNDGYVLSPEDKPEDYVGGYIYTDSEEGVLVIC